MSLELAWITIKLQYVIIQFSFNHLPTGRLREVKNKIKCQIFSSKRGRGRSRARGGRLQLRGFKYSVLTWKILVFWKAWFTEGFSLKIKHKKL